MAVVVEVSKVKAAGPVAVFGRFYHEGRLRVLDEAAVILVPEEPQVPFP